MERMLQDEEKLPMDDAAAAVAAEKQGEGATCNLYGQWQTQEAQAAAASGGRVPRNERGNVEVPPFAPMPEVPYVSVSSLSLLMLL